MALGERGERLQSVEKKTLELSNQASDFLSLAKEINRKAGNK